MSAIDPNGPWDGVWRVPRPDDYVPGIYCLHQITARHLLRNGPRLSHWEALFLQRLAYQRGPLSDLQWHWLRRLERQHERRAA